jgi:hypothetical protein
MAGRVATATFGVLPAWRGTTGALLKGMRNPARHDLRSLAEKAEAEHTVFARECEARWCDELDARRRALAAEAAKVVARILKA